MRIGIFGGTFNPPHNGHVRAAAHAREALGLDKVVFVPASVPPHKAVPPGTPDPGTRLRLTQAAVEGLPWADVSDIEVSRPGVSYTADTVRAFTQTYPDAELWLLTGSDNFLNLQSWYRPDFIFTACSVAVFAREMHLESEVQTQQDRLREQYGAKTAVVELEPVVISSTELRDMIRRGQGSEHLPPKVADLITQLGLYT